MGDRGRSSATGDSQVGQDLSGAVEVDQDFALAHPKDDSFVRFGAGIPLAVDPPLGMRTKSPGPPSTLWVPPGPNSSRRRPGSGTHRCRGPGGHASRSRCRLRFGTGRPRRGHRRTPRDGPPRGSRQRGGAAHPVRSGWVGPWWPAFGSGMRSSVQRRERSSAVGGAVRRLYGQQAGLLQAVDRLAAGGDAELAVDRQRLALDRVRRDIETLAHLPEGQVGRQQRQEP